MGKETIDATLEKWQGKANEHVIAQEEGERQCPAFTMEEWIRQDDPLKDDPIHCRPCRLGVTANWYFYELEDKGHKDLAAVIDQITLLEDPDMPLTLCREFDIIKRVVEEPLRERLKDFDCSTQTFNPNDVLEDEQQQQQNSIEEGSQSGKD